MNPRVWIMMAVFFGAAGMAIAEEMEISTTYPSPYGVYKELRAESYCDENGTNCLNPAENNNKGVLHYVYPLTSGIVGGTFTRTGGGTYMIATVSFTEAQIRANADINNIYLAGGDIAGILIKYEIQMGDAVATEYYLCMGMPEVISGTTDSPSILPRDFGYESAVASTNNSFVTHQLGTVHIMDMADDGDFQATFSMQRPNGALMPGTSSLTVRAWVIGYIVE